MKLPQKHWIPLYQARGELCQARNDKKRLSYIIRTKNWDFNFLKGLLSIFLVISFDRDVPRKPRSSERGQGAQYK